jgi:hypothetical protein
MPSVAAADSQEARRAAYSPSAWEWGARVSITSIARSWSARANGTCSRSPLRQSRNMAWPGRHSVDADWSMMPVGAPT